MSKRILVCSPSHSTFVYPVESALKKLGYEVRVFDYQKGNYLSRLLGFAINRFPFFTSLLKNSLQHYIQDLLIQIATIWKPQLVFVIKGEKISGETLQKIRKLKIKLLNWYPDWLVAWDWVRVTSPFYDYFFPMCEDLAKKTKSINKNTRFFLPAAVPDKITSLKRDISISFVGQRTERREMFFKKIADLGLNIWGYDRWKTSSLHNYFHSRVSANECLDILRKSEITVNILTGDDTFEPKAINIRTFEALGTGTFLLVKDDPLLYKYFQPGKDFVTFKTPNELRSKAKYYLTHERERQKIAEHGWKTVKSKHTYEIRVRAMLKNIEF